ncbi:MAG: PAS domain S-box protein [Spirochaetaceae bacterium]|nr:MAG: PAS domain S-box protein [Spirochaetaceae bacterium]
MNDRTHTPRQPGAASNEPLGRFFQLGPDLMCIVTQAGTFKAVNDAWLDILGYRPDELVGRSLLDYLHPDDHDATVALVRRMRDGERVRLFRNRYRSRAGEYRWCEWNAVMSANGEIFAAARDITDQEVVRDELEASVAHNRMLLREVQHRVKNNLSIVASMLAMDMSRLRDPDALRALGDARERVKTIADLYTLLHRKPSNDTIDLREYLSELVARVYRSMSSPADHVALQESFDPVGVDFDTAVCVGLITNELVTNAFKHAFPGSGGGTVRVEVARVADGRVRLSVSDNGVGLPDHTGPDNALSTGFQLVAALADQIGASVDVEHADGTRISVEFSG